MKYRPFGSTGFQVSALGLGCMRLPVRKLLPTAVHTKKAVNMIRHAIDSGINYIDTAYVYHFGASEKILGLALQDGYREKVHIVTKLPMFMVNKTEDFDRLLNEQLKRLNTGFIDTYLFHALNENAFQKVIDLGLLEKMEEARKKGLIGNIGFSFHDTLPVFKKIIDHYKWDVAQIQYNYLDTTIQATTEGLEYAYSKNIAVVIMEPLKGGLLTKPPKDALNLFHSAKTQRTPVEWALQFLWNRKEVSVVLSGMGTIQMIDENCSYAENSGIDSLSDEDNSILRQIVESYKKQILVPCTACSYCMPCPFGVNIPENFALLNAANSKANNFMDRIWRMQFLRKYRKFAKDINKADRKKPNGAASICTACGKCVPHCPQTINIPEELKKVERVLGKKEKVEIVFQS